MASFGAVAASLVVLLLAIPVNAGPVLPAQAQSGHQTAAGSPVVPPAHFEVTKAASEVRIDGVLDDDAWRRAVVIPLPYEWQPGDNTPPPVLTECLVTFDADNLYVAFRASDPDPSAIRAHLMDRDTIDTFVQDDHVAFMIDTFNDERRGYQFRINPLGVQADAVFSELDGIEDWSWDCIWASAGRIGPDGYVVEVALPLTQLRFQGGSARQTWGFEAFRSYPRNVRHRISSRFTDRNKDCILCQENKVSGFQGIAPGRNLELDPTLTGTRTDARDDDPSGPMVAGDAQVEPGLTARWGITPNLTASLAANPDFSQVEADVAQLEVNTRFALFYPEKRPFFLEGVDFFATPFQAVFTRTVADPAAGLKLTGKQGANAIGVFVTIDRVNNLVIPSNQSSEFASTTDDVTGTVVRYRRDVGARSTLGALATSRESGPYHNRVIGPDAFIRFSGSDTLQVQALWSDTAYPDAMASAYGQKQGSFNGAAVFAQYTHASRRWIWGGVYEDLGRDFRADSGFIPRVDTRTGLGMVRRRFWGTAGTWFTRAELGLTASRTTDHDGRCTDQTIRLDAYYSGPYQTEAAARLNADREYYAGTTYDLTRVAGNVAIQPSGSIRLSTTFRAGDEIDVANARPASGLSLGPALEWKIGTPLNLQLSHTFERLWVDDGWLYTANLTQLRAVYHFGVRTFVRAIAQFTDVSRDPERFLAPVPAVSQQLFTQFLFSYKINPQTVLLLGYSDNYSGVTGVELAQVNRTFFVKVGYAWVL